MDGFNVIPVDKESFKNGNINNQPTFSPVASAAQPVQASTFDAGIEIIDEAEEKAKQAKAAGGSWLFVLSIFSLIGVFGYFFFLVFYRIAMLDQISGYGEQMRAIGQNIDLKEMKEFQDMDTALKAISGRLNKHVLNAQIMKAVNLNIRNTLQVTEYRLDVKDKEVEVNLTAVSPSFKELAEQTEKFFELKENGLLKNFSVSNLSFEQETKRVKFSIRLIFDKNIVNAGSISNAEQQAQ